MGVGGTQGVLDLSGAVQALRANCTVSLGFGGLSILVGVCSV